MRLSSFPLCSLLALGAGLLFPLAFQPYGWWPLLLVSMAFGYVAFLAARTVRRAFWYGWLYGLGMFAFGISWLHVSMAKYGGMSLWLSIVLTGAFAALVALYYGLGFAVARRLKLRALGFAGLWVMLDWLRGWLFTGFPWLYGGYALIDTPLRGLAPLAGVWGVTLAALVLSVTTVELIRRRGRAPVALGATVVLVTLALIGTSLSFTRPAGAAREVALVQGNIPQSVKWSPAMRARIRQIYASLTKGLPADTLVVWPESAMVQFYQDIKNFVDAEGRQVAANGGALITGLPWRDLSHARPRYYNSIAVVGPNIQNDIYYKQKLVPFGEYVPLENLLRGLIPFFNLPMSGFTPGSPDQPNLHALGEEIAPFICYEIVFPDLVAKRTGDADVLLTISDDAWFGTSNGPYQHFQMARMRAVETGRWLLRDTNNGITAIVDSRGQVTRQLPQFTRQVLLGRYQPMEGTTPFMATGPWPVLLVCLLLLVVGGRGDRTDETDH